MFVYFNIPEIFLSFGHGIASCLRISSPYRYISFHNNAKF